MATFIFLIFFLWLDRRSCYAEFVSRSVVFVGPVCRVQDTDVYPEEII